MRGGGFHSFVLLAWTCFLLCCSQSEAVDMNVAVVGWLSFTNSNNVQTSWMPLQGIHSMWVLAIKHFNERNGAFVPKFAQLGTCNKTIRLIDDKLIDDHGKAADAIQAVLQSVPQGLNLVFGAVRSAVTVPLSITCGALNVPVVSHWATSQALSNRAVHPIFTRTIPSDVSVARTMAEAFQLWGFRHVGMIYVQDDFGSAWKDALFSELESRSIQLTAIPFNDLSGQALADSVDNAVRIVAKSNFNVIVAIYLQDETVSHLAASATSRNMTAKNGKLWVFNDQEVPDPSETDNYEAVQAFLQETASFAFSIPGHENSQSNPAWSKMKTYYANNLTASEINWAFPSNTIPGKGQYLIPNDDWFADNIGSMEPVWAFTYDAVALAGIAACSLGDDNTIPSGPDLYKQMLNTSFQGLSGNVKFNNKGERDISTVAFVLSNFVLDENHELGLHTVGEYSAASSAWEISDSIVFPGGSNVPPLDVSPPPHDLNALPTWARAIGYAEVAIVLFLALVCSGFLIAYRNDKIIINSQPAFLCALILGTAFASTAIIPLTIDDTNADVSTASASCMAFPWVFGVGLATAIVSLMAKSYRISVIFNNSKFRRVTATASKFMVVVIVMVCVECSILIAWTLVAPLKFERVIDFMDQYEYPVASHGICIGPAPASGAFVGVLCGMHALQVLMLMRVTQRLTKVPARFQETRWINIAALSMGQLYILGLPSAAAVYTSPLGRFLVLSSVVFFTCTALLVAIFYPKYMMQRYGEEYFDTNESSLVSAANVGDATSYKNSVRVVRGDGTVSPQNNVRVLSDDGNMSRSALSRDVVSSLSHTAN